MPFTAAGATRMLDGMLAGDHYVHLHTALPATSANVITGPGYAGVLADGGFVAEALGLIRRRKNRRDAQFPTPGGAWTRGAAIALWDRANIAANPADPPGKIREALLPEAITGELNDAITLEAGAFTVDIEVTS